MDMEFVVIDDEDDSSSEFNFDKANSGSNRGLIDKLRDSLGFNDEELVIANNGNSLNRRNVNSNHENEVQAPRSHSSPRPRVRPGSRDRRLPAPRPKSRSQSPHDHDHGRHGKQAPGMTRRCACNLSQCASTNYMCKSERRAISNEDGTTKEMESGCFVEELDPGTLEALNSNGVGLKEANGKITSARRGCIEMLSKEKFKLCSDIPGSPVHCCFDEEMCNYPKTFYPPQIHNSQLNHNRISFDSQNGAMPNLDSQVWLRAALLTIPIFGIIILIILIIFARRMLKNDAKDKEYRTARNHHRRSHSHKTCASANHHSIPNNSPSFHPNTSNSSSCPLVRPGGSSPTMPIAELHC